MSGRSENGAVYAAGPGVGRVVGLRGKGGSLRGEGAAISAWGKVEGAAEADGLGWEAEKLMTRSL